MPINKYTIDQQGQGQFNQGQIIENKPIGFPQDGGAVTPYGNLFYWAKATALVDSTIALHPHQGFEIMSFVLEGRIRHYDTQQRDWIPLDKGDVQIIRAGSGISHAEHMEAGSVMFQIWFDPGLRQTLQQDASYDDYRSDAFDWQDGVMDYRKADDGIVMDSLGVEIMRRKLSSRTELPLKKANHYSIYVLGGSGSIGAEEVNIDDFIILHDEDALTIEPSESLELFIVATPTELPYKRYAELYSMSA